MSLQGAPLSRTGFPHDLPSTVIDGRIRSATIDRPTDRQVADYIAQTCSHLQQFADRPNFGMVSYMLKALQEEAEKLGGTPRS